MSSFSILSLTLMSSSMMYGVKRVNGGVYCDDEYNSSSCANQNFTENAVYYCRGFLSCKDSFFDTDCDLYCQGDRSCKNVVYDNHDDDELWAFGYRSADSLTMADESHDAYCYGYQSCLDIVFAQDDSGNDALAYGYQAMYSAYIDYSDEVTSYGYQSLYYATINTTSVASDEIDITLNGYYGSYETDILCQDGITCNVYAYGWYATEETYLYCLRGSTCNVYCGTTNGCTGMNIYAYSTATVYFDCDDATECPSLDDAEASAKLMAYSKSARQIDSKFDEIMKNRLNKKAEKQSEFKQERMREERKELAAKHVANEMARNEEFWYSARFTIIEAMSFVVFGVFFGSLTTYCYNKYATDKDYSYQAIV